MLRESTTLLVVDDPAIREVLDLSSGEILSVRNAVGQDYEKALKLRMALRQGIAKGFPVLACPLCAIPVHLVSLTQERRFYFRHETEDGRCPARTKGNLSEERILAMKYHGARESTAHKRMKEIIAESLRSDPDFFDVQIEKVWKGREAEELNRRRKPDVRAIWKGTLPVAFEIQLSTTFLRVIAERREFYLREGGLLFWVFNQFEMANVRLTMEDVFYNNNRNAFVANEETLAASKESGSLILECVWSAPSVEEGVLTWSQQRRQVRFSELTLEQDKQRAFFFDADAERARAEATREDCLLRKDFRNFWLAKAWGHDHAKWLDFRSRFSERGIFLPSHPGDEQELHAFLNTLYTAAEGRPVGWGHNDLVRVAHHVFDKHKGQLWAFKLMLAAHGRGPQVMAEDATGNWCKKKVKVYREAWADPSREGAEVFAPDRRFDQLLCFLFPEIAAELNKPPC